MFEFFLICKILLYFERAQLNSAIYKLHICKYILLVDQAYVHKIVYFYFLLVDKR